MHCAHVVTVLAHFITLTLAQVESCTFHIHLHAIHGCLSLTRPTPLSTSQPSSCLSSSSPSSTSATSSSRSSTRRSWKTCANERHTEQVMVQEYRHGRSKEGKGNPKVPRAPKVRARVNLRKVVSLVLKTRNQRQVQKYGNQHRPVTLTVVTLTENNIVNTCQQPGNEYGRAARLVHVSVPVSVEDAFRVLHVEIVILRLHPGSVPFCCTFWFFRVKSFNASWSVFPVCGVSFICSLCLDCWELALR